MDDSKNDQLMIINSHSRQSSIKSGAGANLMPRRHHNRKASVGSLIHTRLITKTAFIVAVIHDTAGHADRFQELRSLADK